MTNALKEWAAIERALGAGAVTLLLRKGGLWERRDGFETERHSFWLFPTLYHQNPHELQPRFAWALDAARAIHPTGDQVRLEYFAEVVDVTRVDDLSRAKRLLPFQALTEATVEARFNYRNRPYLHALLLRVWRVPQPHVIPNTLGYEGCVSWVELDEDLSTAGAVPVMDHGEFERVRQQVTSVYTNPG